MDRLLIAVMAICAVHGQVNAACWRTRDSTIIETRSQSTPPIRGARLVDCPTAAPMAPLNIARESRPSPTDSLGSGFERRPDDRQCVAYVRSRMRLPTPGIAFEQPDAEHRQWKIDLINRSAPAAGHAAIIDESAAGHVAYVEEASSGEFLVKGNTQRIYWITISETNYRRGYFQKRTATGLSFREAERKLRILGYHAS